MKKEKEELISELNLISEALENINHFIVCKRIKRLGKDYFEEINILDFRAVFTHYILTYSYLLP